MARSSNIWLGLNRAVEAWSVKTWQLQSMALQHAIKKGTDSTVASLRYAVRKKDYLVEKASFTFNRTAVYIAKGVGGVYHVSPEGSGIVARKTPGPINRHPKDWITPVMDERLPILSETVASEVAKAAGKDVAQTIEVVSRGLK